MKEAVSSSAAAPPEPGHKNFNRMVSRKLSPKITFEIQDLDSE